MITNQQKTLPPAGCPSTPCLWCHAAFLFHFIWFIVSLTAPRLSLIKDMKPPRDIIREAHIALWMLTECMMRVWREDWCQHCNNHLCDAVAAGLLNQHRLILCLSQSRQTCQHAANTVRAHPPPPGRRQSHMLAPGWMEDTFPDYIHCDTVCVCAGLVFLSDSCTLSNPWQQQVLTVLQIIIILGLSSFFSTAEALLWFCTQNMHAAGTVWYRTGTC